MKSLKNFVILILLALSVSFVTSCETSKIEDEIVEQPSDNEDTDGEQDQEDENQTEDGENEDGIGSGDEGDQEDQEDPGDQENQEDLEDPGDQENTGDKEDQGGQEEEHPELDNDEFVILFTNDFHSQIEPTDNGTGGVLRLKALVDSVRTAEPVVLMADAGDLVQGTYYFSLLNGVVEMKMLDALGYDIRTIGNHEFDKKMTGLGEMFAMSKVPVVASNYDFSSTNLSQYVVPAKMLNAGRIKVGFIGLNVRLQNLVEPSACEGVQWQNAINVADQYAEELRNQGADIVIALSHLGYEAGSSLYYYDRGVAMQTRHIDMIIGGHSHTTLKKADYITNLDGEQVPIVQTGDQGRNLGYARIKLDENGKPSFEYRLIPVNSRLDDRIDPGFSDIIEDYAAECKEKMDVKLGYSKYDILRYTYADQPQSRLGNLTADGLIWMAKNYFDVDADVSIYNSGGIRENIYKGDVTLGDVYAVYPFDNVLTILDIKGRDLRELVKSAASGSLPFGGKVKLVVSGGALKSATVDGQQIDDNKTYTVATIDYLANLGRYGLQNATNKRMSVDFIREYFGEYFKYIADRNGGYIDGPLDDRITVK